MLVYITVKTTIRPKILRWIRINQNAAIVTAKAGKTTKWI